MATITVTKGHNAPNGFVTGETVTPDTLNAAQTPGVAISNIVDADLSASAGITAGKLASTLDLTGKTLTLPSTSVTTLSIAGAAVTAAKLDGAQTGSAPIYGCRAWVSFDGSAAVSPAIGGTYARSVNIVTVDTTTPHGLLAGHVVRLDFTSGGVVDGTFVVSSAPTTTQFLVTHAGTGTASGNVSLPRRNILASGNVAHVAYLAEGYYAVNFTAAMPDASYAVTLGGRMRTGFVYDDPAQTQYAFYLASANTAGALENFTPINCSVFR